MFGEGDVRTGTGRRQKQDAYAPPLCTPCLAARIYCRFPPAYLAAIWFLPPLAAYSPSSLSLSPSLLSPTHTSTMALAAPLEAVTQDMINRIEYSEKYMDDTYEYRCVPTACGAPHSCVLPLRQLFVSWPPLPPCSLYYYYYCLPATAWLRLLLLLVRPVVVVGCLALLLLTLLLWASWCLVVAVVSGLAVAAAASLSLLLLSCRCCSCCSITAVVATAAAM